MAMGFSKFKCRPFWSALLLGLIWLLFALFFSSPAEAAVTANAMTLSASEDVYKWIKFNVLAGYGELDGATFTIVTPPTRGTVTFLPADTTLKTGYHAKYVSKPNLFGTDKFAYQVKTKSGVLSNTATVTVNVAAVNDPPPNPPSLTFTTTLNKQTAYFNFPLKDIDGDTLRFAFPTTTGQGQIKPYTTTVDTYGGKYSYYPLTDFVGIDKITYSITDGTITKYATITVTVNPAATSGYSTISEDQTPLVTLPETDSSYKCYLISLPAHGQLLHPASGAPLSEKNEIPFHTNSKFTVRLKTEKDYNGTDAFKYDVYNSKGQLIKRATLNVNILPMNDRPVASDTSAIAKLNTPVVIDLAPHVTDIDVGDTRTFSLYNSTSVKNGIVDIAPDGKAKFTPASNYTGSGGKFTYKVTDSGGLAHNAIVTVFVNTTGINQAPVVEDLFLVAEYSEYDNERGVAFKPVVSDPDGHKIEIKYGQPENGAIFQAGRDWYIPYKGYLGSDSFKFTVIETDANPPLATVGTVHVSVERNRPRAQNVILRTTVNTPIEFDPKKYIEDDQDPITKLSVNFHNPWQACDFLSQCLYSGSSNTPVTYTPLKDYVGVHKFQMEVKDSESNKSSLMSGVIAIFIDPAPSNQPPSATPASYTIPEGEIKTVSLAGSDPENDVLTFEITQPPRHGSVRIVSPTQVEYRPDPGFSGSDAFAFAADDGEFKSSAANIIFSITKINDAPVVLDMSETMNENETLVTVLKGSDPDYGEKLIYSISSAEHAEVSVSGDKLHVSPNKDFNGELKLTYSASDGELASNNAPIVITVKGINQAPVAADLQTVLLEDQSRVITLSATDPEDDALQFAISQKPQHGAFELVGNKVEYVPEENYYGKDEFRFTATDGGGLTSTDAIVGITIKAVADPVIACDMADTSHLKAIPDSPVLYWDNLVGIHAERVLTTNEKTALLAAVGQESSFICTIEQDPLTDDEAGDLIDPSLTGYGFYAVQIATQTEYTTIQKLSDELAALSFVKSSFPLLENTEEDFAAETDIEEKAENSILPNSMPVPYYNHQLEGTLEYLAAYRWQVGALQSVNLAVADGGICSNAAYEGLCVTQIPGFSVAMNGWNSNVIASPNDFYGTLKPTVPWYPIALVDKRENGGMHGSVVAGIIGAESNNSEAEPTFKNIPSSGILGSVRDLGYNIESYNLTGITYDDFSQRPTTPIAIRVLSELCSVDVSNHSYGVLPQIFAIDEAVFMRDGPLHAALLAACPNTLHLFAAGNGDNSGGPGIFLDDGTSFSNYVKLRSSNSFNAMMVQGGNRHAWSENTYEGSNYGSVAPVIASNESTSYSTPIVTGTAGLMKAIDPGISPKTIMQNLIKTGKPNSKGAAYLDIAAAVLTTIKEKNPAQKFSPFSTKALSYVHGAPLSEVTSIAGGDGHYVENTNWQIPEYGKRNQLITAYKQKFTGLAEDGTWNFETLTDIRKSYWIDLQIAKDKDASTRKVPVLTVLPSSNPTLPGVLSDERQSYLIKGKYEDKSDGKRTGSSHCLEVRNDVNATATEIQAKEGIQIPLARNSSVEFTVPYKLQNAQFKGNVIKYIVTDGEEPMPDLSDYENLCDGGLDITADDTSDGEAVYKAFAERIAQAQSRCADDGSDEEEVAPIPPPESPFEKCTEIEKCSCGDCDFHKISCLYCMTMKIGAECTSSNPCEAFPESSSGTTESEPNQESGANPDCACTPKVKEPITLKYNVEVDFSDPSDSCDIHMRARNNYLGGDDITLSGTGGLAQSFLFEPEDIDSACTLHLNANITVNISAQVKYETEGSCKESADISFKETLTDSKPIVWDANAGAFPIKDIFAAINGLLPQAFDPKAFESNEELKELNAAIRQELSKAMIAENALPPRLTGPDFGTDMSPMHWVHGIGPVKSDNGFEHIQLIQMDKLDRTIK